MTKRHAEAARRRWQNPEYRARQVAARRSPLSVEQRIRAKIGPPEPNGCRRWQGSHDRNGYGHFSVRVDGRTVAVKPHRVIYEAEHGPIPEGWTIDHVKERGCRYKDCCEPSHLEAVTMRVNILRSDGLAARNIRKTHCPQGHPYDEANTRHKRDSPNHRVCRTCERARAKPYGREYRRQGRDKVAMAKWTPERLEERRLRKLEQRRRSGYAKAKSR